MGPVDERSDLRCPRCAKALDVKHADGVISEQHCLHCDYRETVRPPRSDRVTRTEVRQLATAARRLLLGPSCYGRRHSKCTASRCECPCHANQENPT